MLRLIRSRVVRLALAVTAVGAVIGAAVWTWRALSRRGGPPIREGSPPAAEPGPPEPVAGHAPAEAPSPPAAPEGETAVGRIGVRTIRRWAYPAAGLCVLAAGGAALGNALLTGPRNSSAEPASRPSVVAVVVAPSRDASRERAPGTRRNSTCRPARGAVAAPAEDPRVTKAVDRQWRRIERWLRTHAPVTYGELRPPATVRTIAIAESQMGVRFPGSLRASLLRHDGSRSAGSGLLGRRALSVREIRDTWRALCAVEAPPGWVSPVARWSGRMIPFAGAFTEGAGDEGVVASQHGRIWRFGERGFAPGPGWTTYYAMLRATAGALESGHAAGGRRPEVSGGRLRWTPN
ncbi:hypothetical protein GCM10022226_79520 [Sphaerisporangium flaviroseum]|uniref:Knr4/Smi1-like domain-containing protein n=1 Tax=Sphaerisporangium flaviroseum TaxID=509199 RepID=A0ABP7JH27_9ACTN